MRSKLKYFIEKHGTVFMVVVLLPTLVVFGLCVMFVIQEEILYLVITFGSFWFLVEMINLYLAKVLGITYIKTRWG